MGIRTLNDVTILVLEMQNSSSTDTLQKMFCLDSAKKQEVSGSLIYELPGMRLVVVKEPKADTDAERQLLKQMKKGKHGIKRFDSILAIQSAEADTLETSMQFLAKKLVPSLGNVAEKKLSVGLLVREEYLPESFLKEAEGDVVAICDGVSSRMLHREQLYAEQLQEFAGKKIPVVAYAVPVLNLASDCRLGVPFNLGTLSCILDRGIPVWNCEKLYNNVSTCKADFLFGNPDSEEYKKWKEGFLKELGEILHKI